MKYSDLVDAFAAKVGASKTEAKKTVDAVFETLAEAIASKEAVIIPALGTFATKDRPAKQGRNPATGEAMEIPAKTVVGFKPGKAIKDRVNG